MKIGILTYHRAVNFGAFLQAYALSQAIKNKIDNAQVEIIDFNMKKARRYYYKMILREGRHNSFLYQIKKYMAFSRSAELLPLSEDKIESDDMEIFQEFIKDRYDVIVAGSDEIWKLKGFRGFPTPYFLPGQTGCRKMSYAASSRSNVNILNESEIKTLQELLSQFDYIGVRDDKTISEFSEVIPDRVISKNCDPTFLYDFSDEIGDYKQVMKKYYGINNDKPCIGFMTHDTKILDQLKKTYGDDLNYISVHIPLKGTKSSPDITPFEFAATIAGLDYMVTSFFHGMCFAIKHGIPFCALEEKMGENADNSKMLDLLRAIGKEDHYMSLADENYVKWNIECIAEKALKHQRDDNTKEILNLVQTSDSFFDALENSES